MHSRTFLIACIAAAVLGGLVGAFVLPARGAERNPNQVLFLGDINHPDEAALEQFAERLKAAGEHNAAMILRPADPIRRANVMKGKGDSLPAIAVRVYLDTMWEMWGPEDVRVAYARKANDPEIEVYVWGTDEYDDTLAAYWPDDRDPPFSGQPLTMLSPFPPPVPIIGAAILAPVFNKP